ncbi:hypothetical protein RB636_38820 [Streptomyces chrestomyceticus]|uniref:DUF7919 domain-containing protein n=1 Tax=Streptomyces chrestomyceticus TaxID=68185 RepID=A0ABU7X5V3_9ACTN
MHHPPVAAGQTARRDRRLLTVTALVEFLITASARLVPTGTYFSDLTPYTYSEHESGGLNVSWLSDEHPYPRGKAPDGLVDALVRLAKDKVNVYRGSHFCELCPTFLEAQKNNYIGGTFVGSGEIHVPGEGSVLYIAPAMIAHYVRDHSYLPPYDFCHSALSTHSAG